MWCVTWDDSLSGLDNGLPRFLEKADIPLEILLEPFPRNSSRKGKGKNKGPNINLLSVDNVLHLEPNDKERDGKTTLVSHRSSKGGIF